MADIAADLWAFLAGLVSRLGNSPVDAIATVFLGLFVLLGSSALLPLLSGAGARARGGLAGACGTMALASLAALLLSNPYSVERSQRSAITVIVPTAGAASVQISSMDRNSAMEIAQLAQPELEWAEDAEFGVNPYLRSVIAPLPSAPAGLPQPNVTLVDDAALGGGRRNVTFRFEYPGASYALLGMMFGGIDEWSLALAPPTRAASVGLRVSGACGREALEDIWVAGVLPAGPLPFRVASHLDSVQPDVLGEWHCPMVGRYLSAQAGEPRLHAPLFHKCSVEAEFQSILQTPKSRALQNIKCNHE